MTQQFKYVGGHIEVYSEQGEFLFSADTMQAVSYTHLTLPTIA